jgi:hypothetical protein
MQNLYVNFENERLHKEGRKQGSTEKTKGKATTRAGILAQAIENARPSAQFRMREAVLQFHEGEIDLLECPVCLEPTGEADIALTPCAHKFCAECIVNVLDGASTTREAKGHCPECRDVMTRSELTFLGDAKEAGEQNNAKKEEKKMGATEVSTEVNGFHLMAKDIQVSAATGSATRRVCYNFLTDTEKRQQKACCYTLSPNFLAAREEASSCLGTKISRLLEEVKAMTQKDPKSKCVVFSQFLGTLDIASQEMTARGIRFVRVDGNMKQHQRADALLDFSSDPNIRVFLLSMRAGAAGLNLMAADHCFILDAPMNSAVEEQAIDR